MARGRPIAHVAEASGTPEGAGAFVRRAIPLPNLGFVDPFLLLDEFSVSPPAGFPLHPHRGFEIITYLLEGGLAHGDSAGNRAVVGAGGLQKITAGRGMEHSETPAFPGTNRGLQLWINLARAEKQIQPEYQEIQPNDVPVERQDGATVRLLAGEGSPIRLHTPLVYLDVTLDPAATFSRSLPAEWQGAVYVLSGAGSFGSNQAPGRTGQVLVFGPAADDGNTARAAGTKGAEAEDGLHVTADPGESLRFALVAGRPHREPVRWFGPFVD
jgi:quercetin 2,3-dioxygenase